MTARSILRVLGVVDLVSGALLLAAATWFAEQLDLGVATVRIAALVALVVGVDTLLMQAKPVMARVAMVIEALVALVAIDVVLLRDPTGIGVAMLLATALYGVAAAIELWLVTRSRPLVTA